MKTKNLIRFAAILIAVVAFSVAGCKKDKTNDATPDSSSMQQLSKDQNDVETSSNDAMNDVSNVLSGGSGKSLEGWPCNATIDSSKIVNDSINKSRKGAFIFVASRKKGTLITLK